MMQLLESSAGRVGESEILSYLWLQATVRGKQVILKKVQWTHNMADLRTKTLKRKTISRDMEKFKCVRLDQ